MRPMALLAAVCLLAACGDDAATSTAAFTSTSAGTTTQADTTTSRAPETTTSAATISSTATTYAWETFAVAEADLCVIEHGPGETLNVRSGPGTGHAIVGTLAYDQTGVHATGVGARDSSDRVWKEIDYFGAAAWVASWLLTQNSCEVAAPTDFCVTDTVCTDRLNVRSGPAGSYRKLGSLPFDTVGVQGTGASSTDPDGRTWRQVRFRGGVGWAASWFLDGAPCSPFSGDPCSLPSGAPTATCTGGWTTPEPGSALWRDALANIGVGAPWSEVPYEEFVVEEMRHCLGPEDVNILAPRPIVERYYIVGYSEADPSYRGRWLLRKALFGLGLAAVADHDSVGWGAGVWQACVDPCQVGRPLFDEWCEPGCVEDYTYHPCEGVAPGTWVPGDCSGPPPEVLGCFG